MPFLARCLRHAARLSAALLLVAPLGCAGQAGTAAPDTAPRGSSRDWLQLAANQGGALAQERGVPGSPAGDYLAGLVAEQRHDLSAAVEFLSRALAADPDNPELLLQTFTAASAAGRRAQAVELAQRLLARQDDQPLARIVLAVDALSQADTARARRELAALPDRGLWGISGPLLRAWAAGAEGAREDALEAIDALAGQAGFTPLAALHRALILDVLGDERAASEAYQAALEAMEEPPVRAAWLVGNFLERQGEREQAAALYRRVIEQSGDSGDVLKQALAALERGERPAPAVADARQGTATALLDFAGLLAREQAVALALVHAHLALAVDPGMATAQILIGEIMQRIERPEEAIAAYRRVPADSSFAWTARLRIAEDLGALGRTEEAIAELEALAAERTEDFEPLYRLGNLLRSKERFEAAVDAYDRAVARIGMPQPQHWSLFYFRGIALERSKRWPRAEADLLQALELRPEQPYVMNYLAYSWVEMGANLERALTLLERAVELRPQDGFIVDSLGWVYYRLGRYEPAVELLERAVALEPLDPVINDHLGDAYWRTGRKREARVQWRRALSLDPEPERIAPIEAKVERGLEAEAEPI